MQGFWIRKGDDRLLVTEGQLKERLADGWERVPPDQGPSVGKVAPPAAPAASLVRLVKDGAECYCSEAHLEAFLKLGWRRPGEEAPMPGESNSVGTESVKNDGSEKTTPNPATIRSGSNSPRVPSGSGPQAVSGGTVKSPGGQGR